MTDRADNNKDFTLNHLDDLDDQETKQPEHQDPFGHLNLDAEQPAAPQELFNDSYVAEDEPTPSRQEPTVGSGITDDSSEHETAPFIAPLTSPVDEPPVSERQDSSKSATTDRLQSALPMIAIVLAIIAIVLNLTAPASNDSRDAIEEQAALNEELYREMKLELEMLTRKLESQQTYLRDSLQAQINRINAKPASVKRPTVTPVKVKKPTPVAPVIISKTTGWAVNLLSVDNRETANKEKERLNDLGIAAEVATLYINNSVKYRVRVSGFESKESAAAYKSKLTTEYGINDAWVYKP